MARMSELMIDTEIMLRDGFTVDQIVEKIGIPSQWVLTIRDMMDMVDTDSDRFETCNFVEEAE
jgi:hypothetical protein